MAFGNKIKEDKHVNDELTNLLLKNTDLHIAASKEFIDLLFAKLDCFVEFRFVKDNEVVQRFYRGTHKIDWREIQTKNENGFNVFYGVAGRQRESGKKQDVSIVPAFWVDIDSTTTLHPYVVLSYFKKFTPSEIFFPSYTVASGHGAHAYWFLEQPIAITDDEARLKAEGYLLGLAKFFHGDSVHDLGRVMRLPETINWKDVNDPVPCQIASCDSIDSDDHIETRRFKLEDFERFRVNATSNESVKKLTFDNNTPMPDLSRLQDGIRYLITNPPPKGQRSNACFIVMKAMQNAGYNHNEIKAVFMNNPIGDRYAE
jgi:hypothetical protein